MTFLKATSDVMQAEKELRPACRSLLQKAVRRGNTSLVEKVASYLYGTGDSNWIYKRTAIITFEECWPLAAKLSSNTSLTSIIEALVRVSQSIKFKDATGLGTLALALSGGDHSVLLNSPEDYHIIVVSEGIRRPSDFWNWATSRSLSKQQLALIHAAQEAYRRGGWPWDKAFMQAAAYLTITQGIPEVRECEYKAKNFLFWTALDKHTPQGKRGLREAAKVLGIPPYQLFWISFYFESALTNESVDSFWWSHEIQWRLSQIGLDYQSAQKLWNKAQPVVAEILKTESKVLQEQLDMREELQLKLFDESGHQKNGGNIMRSEEDIQVESNEDTQQASLVNKQVQLRLFQ